MTTFTTLLNALLQGRLHPCGLRHGSDLQGRNRHVHTGKPCLPCARLPVLNQPHSPWRHRGVLPLPHTAFVDVPRVAGRSPPHGTGRSAGPTPVHASVITPCMSEVPACPHIDKKVNLGRTLPKNGHSWVTLRQKRCGRCLHWPNMTWGLTAVAPRPYMQAAKTAGGRRMAACASPPAFYSILPCCVTHENQQHLHSKGAGEQGKSRRRVEPQAVEQILLQVPPLHPETHQQLDGAVWKRPDVHLQACPEDLHNGKGQDK